MKKIKTDPKGIWNEYQNATMYNERISLYDTVKQNENFFVGRQWEGVDAPDLDKPVFNILKRICSMFIAQIVSDDITASVEPFTATTGDVDTEHTMRIIGKEISRAIEYSGAKSKNRDMLRNACVDGDGCFYMYFDDKAETGQIAKGLINIEVVDNTNILFGNPYSSEVQRQPYILILQRRTLDSVREEAKANGISEDDISSIIPDSDQNLANEEHDSNLVSVIVKLWKEDDTVHCAKTTQNVHIRKPWDTGLKLYPVSYMSWEKVKNSYHGQAAVTGLIPNQIFINKCYAMGMDYVKKLAFPKLVYDKNRLPNGWDNRIGRAIQVEGNVTDAVASAFKMPDMSAQVMELVEKTMTYTKEYMGASDATLGNIRPDNAAAIVAVQKSTNAPLELQKMAFYQFVEDYIRIFLDIMRVNYGLRNVGIIESQTTMQPTIDMSMMPSEPQPEMFDFSILENFTLNLNVNVGASAYWSEIMQVQTADNLFSRGIITDPVVYLDSIPDSYIKNKQTIVDDIKAKIQEQQMAVQQAQTQQMQQTQSSLPGKMPLEQLMTGTPTV